MATLFVRLILAGILAATAAVLGGCVLTRVEVGFDLSKPAPYVHVTIGDAPQITPNAPVPLTINLSGQVGATTAPTPAQVITVAPPGDSQ